VINYTAFIELEKRQIILFIAPMIADWAVHLKPRNMAINLLGSLMFATVYINIRIGISSQVSRVL